MLVLDTSFLVAIYNENDALNQKAKEKFVSDKILLNDFIIDELATVLLNRCGQENANKTLEALFDNSDVEIMHTSKEEFFEIAEYFKKQKSKLSFTDCSIVLLARRSGARIITFDKKMEEIEKNWKS